MFRTVDEVVDELGGTAAVADLCGTTSAAVSNWRSRRKIPSDKFLVFESALRRRGHDAPKRLFTFDTSEARA
jgi:DNA-binding transcriptional regulator YdaS (Cro superfamily)